MYRLDAVFSSTKFTLHDEASPEFDRDSFVHLHKGLMLSFF